jgi:hypothetical protein
MWWFFTWISEKLSPLPKSLALGFYTIAIAFETFEKYSCPTREKYSNATTYQRKIHSFMEKQYAFFGEDDYTFAS